MDNPEIDRITSRSICDAVGERLQKELRQEPPPPSPRLQRLMEELQRRDGESRRKSWHWPGIFSHT